MATFLLIQAGGLLAMAGGLAAASLGLLHVVEAVGMGPGLTENALRKGHYENPATAMLLVGVLGALAALHFMQRRHYGGWGTLASIAALMGVAMVLAGGFAGEFVPSMSQAAITLVVGGVLVASVGIVVTGIATVVAGVLPRWCGAAVVFGSPPGVGLMFAFFTPLVAAGILPGEAVWVLAGAPWLAAGLAVFRAGTVRRERPSRAR